MLPRVGHSSVTEEAPIYPLTYILSGDTPVFKNQLNR